MAVALIRFISSDYLCLPYKITKIMPFRQISPLFDIFFIIFANTNRFDNTTIIIPMKHILASAVIATAMISCTSGNGIGTPDSSWHGAEWIGAPDTELPCFPQYMPVFCIDYTYTTDGNNNTVFLGANDMRLAQAHLNKEHVAAAPGTSYIAIELDDATGTARLLRRNYKSDEDTPTLMAEGKYTPDGSKHTITAKCELGLMDIYIDGDSVMHAGVGPYGNSSEAIAYPMLADVGITSDGNISDGNIRIYNLRSPHCTVATIADISSAPGDTAWITPPTIGVPMLRTTIDVAKPLRSATWQATARGIYHADINGMPTSDEYFAPGSSQYNRTHFYNTTDITPLLRQGNNTLQVQVAEGWWCGAHTYVGRYWNFYGDRPALLSLVILEYEDGSVEYIPSRAADWQYATDGPVMCGSFFQGEVYDPSRKPSWHQAVAIPTETTIPAEDDDFYPSPRDYSQWKLQPVYGPGVTAVDTLTAVAMTQPMPGVYIYNMGQNFAGVPSITLRNATPGSVVNMRFAEVLYPEMPEYDNNSGEMMMENIRAAMAQDRYTVRGDSMETFSPRNTFHGYQYIEISGVDTPPALEDVKGIVLSSVPEFTASFRSSDPTLNRFWQNIKWSTRANFLSIPTDCPQRNERMGWSGDIGVFTPSANYLADTYQFLRRHTQALRDGQHPDGRFPDIAPSGFGFGGILWGSAGVIIPYECYAHYGDTTILTENYDAMARYMQYIADKCIDPETNIIVQNRQWGDLGDWLSPELDRNDKSLIWEAYYVHLLDMMARSADVLGKTNDADAYRNRRAERIDFFKKTYVDPDTHRTRFSAFGPKEEGELVDTQISYALPIAFGLVDPNEDPEFAQNFINTVTRTNTADDGTVCPPYSLMTGFIGTARITEALTKCGADAEAYALLTSHNYPSWLYPVDNGATSIWERLNSYTNSNGFGGNNGMNSFNHYSFGAVAEWIMNTCAGIRPSDDGGFKSFILQPVVDPRADGLKWMEAFYTTPYGTIVSGWRRQPDGSASYVFEVPEGTTATLRLPGQPERTLTPGQYTF